MDRKFFLVAVAGGRGVRMGSEVPKQFLPLKGKAVLERTISRFVEAFPGLSVVTVLPKEHISAWDAYCSSRGFSLRQTIVPGGITRFHSVRAALSKVPDGAIVAIHDGVRPLVSVSLLRRMAERMATERALIPVVPVTDTLKILNQAEGGALVTAPDSDPVRSRYYAAQTPQMFLSEEIKAAYAGPFDPSFTDDASVARRNDIPLSYIEGERYNIKITTPEDLVLAETVMDHLVPE
ncbi:MAG: 2-C-methyl-D-erythritol 4-phosphate cytidylyltransferase [Bacteroidales bacterium]|nr:2-C-methyl-D-erythritol 4-phosphate cytidylyltransferase [Bacteroidales bacterium]